MQKADLLRASAAPAASAGCSGQAGSSGARRDPKGNDPDTVSDRMIGVAGGRIACAALACGGSPAAHFDERQFMPDKDGETRTTAPGFGRDLSKTTTDTNRSSNVCTHDGYTHDWIHSGNGPC